MNTTVSYRLGLGSLFALTLVGAVTLSACDSCKGDTDPPSTTSTSAPSASAPPVASVQVDQVDPPAGITPRIRAEVDNRDPDAGHSGKALTAAGATGRFTVPSAWAATTADGWSMSKAADGKIGLSVTKFVAIDDAATKAAAGAKSLGFSDCSWAAPESVSVGKDKLAGTAADGLCKLNGVAAPVAYVALPGEDAALIAVGGWAEGVDAAPLFASYRSVAKAAAGDASGIAACCNALRGNGKVAPLHQQGMYAAAAAACDAVRKNPQGRAALAQVRALLVGAKVPAACR